MPAQTKVPSNVLSGEKPAGGRLGGVHFFRVTSKNLFSPYQ
jgi:hypothetical protein